MNTYSQTALYALWMDFQQEVRGWADETFPGETNESLIRHIREEFEDELVPAVQGGADHDLAEELADVTLMIMGIAHRNNIHLQEAMRLKFEKLKKRRWGEPDEFGVVHHIKEVTA
jgi:NTP pyrophosphatase (non-canonical NTP hydrolase)